MVVVAKPVFGLRDGASTFSGDCIELSSNFPSATVAPAVDLGAIDFSVVLFVTLAAAFLREATVPRVVAVSLVAEVDFASARLFAVTEPDAVLLDATLPAADLARFLGELELGNSLPVSSTDLLETSSDRVRFFPFEGAPALWSDIVVTAAALLLSDRADDTLRTPATSLGGGTMRSSSAEATLSWVKMLFAPPFVKPSRLDRASGAWEEETDSGAICVVAGTRA